MPILFGLGIPVGAMMLFIATRPAAFRIARSRVIEAPPSRVFSLIQDLHQWAQWSPWEKLDSSMKKTYSGTSSGVGAHYAWEGNNKVGHGSMEIREAISDERVVVDLKFIKPFAADNVATFTLAPQGNGTHVEWAMTGHNHTFLSKFFGMVMVGALHKDFDSGLAGIASVAAKS
jgi:uncharacterized protein YndB with AHSA1/START domain